jgi:hypothetical protein
LKRRKNSKAGGGKREAGSRRQEAGGGRREAGGRRREAGGGKQEAGSRRREAGGRMQEAGSGRQEAFLTRVIFLFFNGFFHQFFPGSVFFSVFVLSSFMG